MATHIPFIKPELPPAKKIAADLKVIYKNNYYSNNGPIYHKFAAAMENYFGQNLHVVGLCNATIALMLAMKACLKPQRRYVALPAFTFPAGPLAIKWCGWEPVFFDIDQATAQPSLSSFEKLYAKFGTQLAGILLVNNFGIGNEEIAAWERMAKHYELPLIIDSAPGIGSTYPNGNLLGGRGDCEVFSMHVTKPFGIGEGGLVVTRDAKLAGTIESLKNFGLNSDKLTYEEGLNGKITELDCAVGLRILEDFKSILKRRRAVHAMYEKALKGSEVRFLPHARRAAIQFVTIMVNARYRDKILAALKSHQIDARTYYAPPLQTHPLFRQAPKVDLAATNQLSKQIISLPLYNDMSQAVVERICSVVLEVIERG